MNPPTKSVEALLAEVHEIASRASPQFVDVEQWKINEFSYGPDGHRSKGMTAEKVSVADGGPAARTVVEEIKRGKAYALVLDDLGKDKENKLGELIYRFARSTIEGADRSPNEMATDFQKEIHGESRPYHALVDLLGLVVYPGELRFTVRDESIVLRPVTPKDFQRPVSPWSLGDSPPTHDAALELSGLAHTGAEAQDAIYRALAVLRLLVVGSLQWESYQLKGVGSHRSAWVRRPLPPRVRATVGTVDEDALRAAWRFLHGVLPRDLYRPGEKREYRSIAYDRYCEALLAEGSVEKAIATAVMALESLYFKEGETGELAYRLALRTAKVMGGVGDSPHKVRDVIGDAYTIRSTYVHGGVLGHSKMRRIRQTYSSPEGLLKCVLDCVRKSIVVFVGMPMEKEAFLDLIDDSFVDLSDSEKLGNLLANVRPGIRA